MYDTEWLKDLPGRHLIVAGEVGIDQYIWGECRRISPEAPVPIVEVEQEGNRLGLAGNVAQNIVSLGAKATLLSVCGEDEDGEKLRNLIGEAGISQPVLMKDVSRPTLRKVRIVAQKQHVVRIDYEKNHSLSPELAKRFRETLCDLLPSCDGIILQDYGKGIWNPDTVSFIKEAKEHKKPVYVDPSRQSSLNLYRGATLLSPNLLEAELLCGLPHLAPKQAAVDSGRLEKMGQEILKQTAAEHAVITLGAWGMAAFSQKEPRLQHIPTFAHDVFDVTGAGDTVIAVLGLTHSLGFPIARSMQMANVAARVVVRQIGAATVSPEQFKREVGLLVESGLLPV